MTPGLALVLSGREAPAPWCWLALSFPLVPCASGFGVTPSLPSRGVVGPLRRRLGNAPAKKVHGSSGEVGTRDPAVPSGPGAVEIPAYAAFRRSGRDRF